MYSLLITFALVSIITSFLCSLWEAVLLSITPTYAQIKLREGGTMVETIAEFKDNIDRPLAAILTLNTIAHTVGAIGVGAQATEIWSDSNPLIVGIFVPVAMTALVLLLSEIIPKTLGANYWKSLVPFTIKSLRIIITLLGPIIWICQLITRYLKKEKGSVLSRSDFLTMAEIGAQEGVFKQQETDFIKNLLSFNQVTAKDIMTPRVVVKRVSEKMTLDEFYAENKNLPFSRIPVHAVDKTDSIIGYVLKNDVLNAIIEHGGEQNIGSIKRAILMVQEDEKLPALFKKLVEKREHISVVLDSFGGLSGVATMEDIIETMLGMEIIDEVDHTEDMRLLARKKWKKRAQEIGLDLDEPPENEPK